MNVLTPVAPRPPREVIVEPPRDSVSVERTRSKSRRRTTVTQTVEAHSHRHRTPSSAASSRSRTRTPAPSVPPPPSRDRHRRRSSPIRIVQPGDVVVDDVIEPRADVAMILPGRSRRSDRDLRDEIRALEAERRMLKMDRGSSPPEDEFLEVRREPKGE